MAQHRRRSTGTTGWRNAALLITGSLTMVLATASPALAGSAPTHGSGVVYTGSKTVGLNVRPMPSTTVAPVSSLPTGWQFMIVCQRKAQLITGTVRTTDLWDRLSTGMWVSDAYVRRTNAPIPVCTLTPPPAPGTETVVSRHGWLAPIAGGVGSGFRTKTRPTHDGVDIAAARNTPIRAVAAGTVITVVCNASTKNCDVDGGATVKGCGWYVEIQHADKVVTRYCHLIRRPAVQEGQPVVVGQVIGNVGSSGHSSGPHLHFEIHISAAPVTSTNAIDPVPFLKAHGVALP